MVSAGVNFSNILETKGMTNQNKNEPKITKAFIAGIISQPKKNLI